MHDASSPKIRIGQLRLRVPGRNSDEGRLIADVVSRHLAQRLTPGPDRHLGGLTVRLHPKRQASPAETAANVAAAIAAKLTGGENA